MNDTLLDTLADARDALLALGVPVLLSGAPEPDPSPAEMVILQPVSDTGLPTYGLAVTTKRVQVACYAPRLARALELDALSRAALRGIGLRFIASRPAPDPEHVGMLSEYRR